MHFFAFFIPLGILILPKNLTIPFLLFLLSVAIFVEISRREIEWFREIFERYLGFMLKAQEHSSSITGASYLLFSSLLVTLLFDRETAAFSLFFLSIGDSIAGIIGAVFGRHRINKFKTLEGSLAMFISCFIITLFMKGMPFTVKILLSLAATLVEAIDFGVDDNLLIPLFSGVLIWFFKQTH